MLGELADRVGLSSAYSVAMPWPGEWAPVHDRGRLLAQVAVMLAAGGRCVADVAALRDQPALFGQVVSDPTIWRSFDAIDGDVLDALRAARADAHAAVWARRRRRGPVLLDVDASLVEIHSENKQGATVTSGPDGRLITPGSGTRRWPTGSPPVTTPTCCRPSATGSVPPTSRASSTDGSTSSRPRSLLRGPTSHPHPSNYDAPRPPSTESSPTPPTTRASPRRVKLAEMFQKPGTEHS